MLDRTVTLQTADGPMDAYLALPEGAGPHPALVVLQEAFGVNAHIRDVCRRFAAEGFVALAPEVFHRSGRGIDVPYAELPVAIGYLRECTNDGLAMDVAAALAHLRSLPEVAPARVGVVGYCMGGLAAFIAACRTDVNATVVYYGGGLIHERPGMKLRPPLGEAASIRAPLQGHFGSEDPGIPVSDVEMLRDRLTELGKDHEIHVYTGAGHAFFCDARPAYVPAAAALAWSRTLAWLRLKLA